MATLAKLDWSFHCLCYAGDWHPTLLSSLSLKWFCKSPAETTQQIETMDSWNRTIKKGAKANQSGLLRQKLWSSKFLRNIYSFGKLRGTWNTQAGGTLALNCRRNKVFPPGLDSTELSVWFLSPSWPQRWHLAFLNPCFLLCSVHGTVLCKLTIYFFACLLSVLPCKPNLLLKPLECSKFHNGRCDFPFTAVHGILSGR